MILVTNLLFWATL